MRQTKAEFYFESLQALLHPETGKMLWFIATPDEDERKQVKPYFAGWRRDIAEGRMYRNWPWKLNDYRDSMIFPGGKIFYPKQITLVKAYE